MYLLTAALLLAGVGSAGIPAATAAHGEKSADTGHTASALAETENHSHHCRHDGGCQAHCASLAALVVTITLTPPGAESPSALTTIAAPEDLPAPLFRPPIALG